MIRPEVCCSNDTDELNAAIKDTAELITISIAREEVVEVIRKSIISIEKRFSNYLSDYLKEWEGEEKRSLFVTQ